MHVLYGEENRLDGDDDDEGDDNGDDDNGTVAHLTRLTYIKFFT